MTRPDCVCGHPAEWHEHFHDHGYCGTCGRELCRSYRPPRASLLEWLTRLLSRS